MNKNSYSAVPDCCTSPGVSFSGESTRCVFPRQWWGRWHQATVGEVIIKKSDINTKGHCYEQYRDYYLIDNRSVS
jgi:hypothetical protein